MGMNVYVFFLSGLRFIGVESMRWKQTYLDCLDFVNMQLNMRERRHQVGLTHAEQNKRMNRCMHEIIPHTGHEKDAKACYLNYYAYACK